MNRRSVEGQIEGSIAQGVGFALFEELAQDGGSAVNPSFIDYKIPCALDMPVPDTFVVEVDDPEGRPLYGAKGVGEPGLVPTAAAVANAIADATGIRLHELPMNPERVYEALIQAGFDQALERVGVGAPSMLWRAGGDTVSPFPYTEGGLRMSHLRKLLGVTLALAWVVAGTSFWSPSAQAADAIKFGAALPLTGPLATEGKKQRTGYELWKNLVNKQGGINVGGKKMKVEIVYYDYESKTPTATKLFERLITKDKVQLTFGPFGSGATASVAAMTERYGMPMIAPTASSAKLYARGYKYLFGLLVPNDFPADSFFQLVMSQDPKPKTMAFVTRNDFFPKVITKVFQGISKDKYGLKEVYYAQFPKDAKGHVHVADDGEG